MDRSVSSVSTTLSSVDVIVHNTLNPVMELLFHVQIGGIFEPFVDETDLASIAHSCHFYPWYYVTRREPTIPLDALLDPFSRGESSYRAPLPQSAFCFSTQLPSLISFCPKRARMRDLVSRVPSHVLGTKRPTTNELWRGSSFATRLLS